MNRKVLKAPFPYFGGKSRIAPLVWSRFGEVKNYVEPFCGSCAVLLANPQDPSPLETVNDIDVYLANFWRALQSKPEKIAELMDWPVNECDLEARHKYLVEVNRKAEHVWRMKNDPYYYDLRMAAWWCWGLCAWIGTGWCSGEWRGKRQHLSDSGQGVHAKGVSLQKPKLGHGSSDGINAKGVSTKRPHLSGIWGDGAIGVQKNTDLIAWMQSLAARLRRVRVCCGDWSRVCTRSVTTTHGLTAVFLDPPYSAEANRDNDLYAQESLTVAHDVRRWCIENQNDPLLRIALCGYEGEHDLPGWECVAWKANGGMANIGNGQGKANAHRERVWFSPNCLREKGLFG